MAYEGWIISIGKWKIPNKYIQPETYKIGLDKDLLKEWTDYRNKRHVVYAAGVSAGQTTIQFETPEKFKMTNKEMGEFHKYLEAAKHNVAGVNNEVYAITYYNPQTNSYEVKDFTLESMQYTVWGINEREVIYSPVKFSFLEVEAIDS